MMIARASARFCRQSVTQQQQQPNSMIASEEEKTMPVIERKHTWLDKWSASKFLGRAAREQSEKMMRAGEKETSRARFGQLDRSIIH